MQKASELQRFLILAGVEVLNDVTMTKGQKLGRKNSGKGSDIS